MRGRQGPRGAHAEGVPDSEALTALLGERGGQGQGEAGLCVVMNKPRRCQRDGPEGGQLVVAPLEESPPGTAVCLIPPGQEDAPWICESIFQVVPEKGDREAR